MLGGQYKKTTYLNEYRKTDKNLIVVDSGDLLNEHAEIKESFMASARLKAELLAKVYKDVGIDAINVGELELALGVDYLKDLEEKHDLPFVSANIVDDENRLVFKPYVIKKMGGLKVGIIGLMGTTSDVSKLMDKIAGTSLSVLDPMETAETRVAELKDKTDFIIVLTHQHMGRNWVIARKIDGVDVIVGGHHKQKLDTPYEANNTFIVQSGEKGQHQGMLEVAIGTDGSKTAENSLIPMNDKIADDATVKKMIDEFNLAVNKLYTSGISEKEETVELKLNACEMCHGDVYDIWKNTKHAKAFQTLIDKRRQFNPDCLACHTTRFEQTGGFTMEAQEKELRNVQCDSCHGDSTMHLEDPGSVPQGNPGMETCIKCHTEHRCPDFEKNYSREWEKIKH